MKLLDLRFVLLNVICVLNIILLLKPHHAHAEIFTVGYLTGSQRKPGDMEYDRPGKMLLNLLFFFFIQDTTNTWHSKNKMLKDKNGTIENKL